MPERRADMFMDLDQDPRENGPALGDERSTLVESLRCQRLTLEIKCAGLDAEQMARRSVPPSTMSLLGLVRHLAEMERGTFREMLAGQDVPRLYISPTNRDGDFDGAVADPAVVAEAWAAWRAEVAFAEQFVAEAPSLDITGDDPLNEHGSGGGAMSLREALVGTIEEYARHMGHADFLREQIDGRLGQLLIFFRFATAPEETRAGPRYGAGMTTFLIGGGWSARARSLVYGPFLEAAGARPVVACVVLDEGDGLAQFDRWAEALLATAPCEPLAVLVPAGSELDVAALGDADGVLVCGGLTPAYAASLAPVASDLAQWLEAGRPYAGFSAGAAIAAPRALVGGWRVDGVAVCAEDAGEDLDEVTVLPGLGLVPVAIEVHAAQWGTLGRMVGAVRAGLLTTGLAIDEDTMLTVDGGSAQVHGLGQVHGVNAAPDRPGVVEVRSWTAGEVIDLEA